MDTPNMMSGEFYSTHKFENCRSFKKCNLCARCESFSKYQAQCLLCESRKKPMTVCDCNPETKHATWIIMKHFDGPMFDPNRKAGEGKVNYADVDEAKKWADITKAMQLHPREIL